MEKLDFYRRTVQNVLASVAAIPSPRSKIAHEAVFDSVKDRYLVISVGWKEPAYQPHSCLVHADIKGGKTWIQRDGTEDGSSIILAFHSKSVRPDTGCAVA